MRKKIFKVSLWLIAILLVGAYFYLFLPVWGVPFNTQRHGKPPFTPAWALECWLWEDDVNTSEYVDELLAGYREYDIPVRTILLDSPWSLRYNDFEIDTLRYRNPDTWFNNLEDDGYRVVLWMTAMVNSFNKDARIKENTEWYQQVYDKGFLTAPSKPIKWWKGKGGFIDYSNADAMKWWHGLQQQVFDLGIDGWKLDGTATLVGQQWGHIPFFYRKTASGLMSTHNYMDRYYSYEYQYGLTQNKEFVTLSRAMNRGYHPEGFAPIDASPVNWVGDQEHKWVTDKMRNQNKDSNKDIALEGIQGFESAIENVLKSADFGYSIIGSDIGGFSRSTIPARLYIRWAQFSTFCGLFLNGGHGERRLWIRLTQDMEVIRKYAWFHTALVPYMYHYVVTAHEGGRRLQTTLSKGKDHYMFGDDFLIAPIYLDSKNRKVSLPKGKWRYFFEDNYLLEGSITFEKEFALEEFPVYVKEGAIIPLKVKRGYTNLGDGNSDGFITFLIFPDNQNTFKYYHTSISHETEISYLKKYNELKISFKGTRIPYTLRIHSVKKPNKVLRNGKLVSPMYWNYDVSHEKIIIKSHLENWSESHTVQF